MQLAELRQYKDQILALAARNGVDNVRVFGSVARGDAQETSDIDLLVTPLPKCGWGFFSFGAELESLLGCTVDIVSDRAINKYIRDAVLAEAVPLVDDGA